MKIYVNGDHVKTIPLKYAENGENWITLGYEWKSEKKRLSKEERFDLEVRLLLFKNKRKLIDILGLNEKLITEVNYVLRKFESNYVELVFTKDKKNYRVKVIDLCEDRNDPILIKCSPFEIGSKKRA